MAFPTMASTASRGHPTRSAEPELELEHWLGVLRRRASLFAAVLVGVLVVGLVMAWVRPAAYEASATVTFDETAAALSSAGPPAPVIATELRLARSAAVVDSAAGQDVEVEVTADEATPVLTFTARGSDPSVVTRAADDYARRYVAVRREQVEARYTRSVEALSGAVAGVERRLGSPQLAGPQNAGAREVLFDQREEYLAAIRGLRVAAVVGGSTVPVVTEAAEEPDEPAGPGTLGTLGYALVAALFLAGAATALAEFRDRSVRGPGVAQELAGAPVLGALAPSGSRSSPHTASSTPALPAVVAAPLSPEAEAVRSVRAALLRAAGTPCPALLVAGCQDDDGAAGVAADLAAGFARGVGRTLLLRLELAGSTTSSPQPRPSCEVTGLLEGTDLAAAVSDYPGVDDLRTLTVDVEDPDALRRSAVSAALTRLRTEHPTVVVHAPAVLRSSVASHVADQVDGVVLCVRPGSTEDRELHRASERMALVQARVIGVVLT